MPVDHATLAKEYVWLRDHPDFEERPASIIEFLGPEYLNIEHNVRKRIKEVLVDIFGTETNPDRIAKYERAMITGGIGTGKTTIASIVIPYMAHWTLCLKDPQAHFGLMAGTRIAFMQMSTSGPQAKEVVFGDIKARIDHSPWFQRSYPYDPKFTNSFRFPKDIWILPGDSVETTFEGYNILGGIMDEMDSHKITRTRDYADQGHTTISNRITSRFGERGFLLLIGQMKKATGFAAKMYKLYKQDPEAYTVLLTIWESIGWERWTDPVTGKRDSFWYDVDRFEFSSENLAKMVGYPPNIIEVPRTYERDFLYSPQKALRDLAGRPPVVAAPFFHDVTKIDLARDAWCRRTGYDDGPVSANGQLADWFVARNSMKRVCHVDIAYSGDNGDALGLAIGHAPERVVVEGEPKPYIVIDLLMRIKAPPGREIFLGDVRRIIYDLIDKRKFNIVKLTTDGFQSTDFRQQVQRRRIFTEVLSTDKSTLPYFDLYDAIMEERIAIPPYMTQLNFTEPTPIDILRTELSQLQEEDNGKIDHPPDGSKDVADALACVVCSLMGNRTYQRQYLDTSTITDDGSGLGDNRDSILVPRFDHPVATGNLPRAPIAPKLSDPIPWRPPKTG